MDQGSYTRKVRDVARATGPRGPHANPYRDATGGFMASVAGGAAYAGCTNCYDVQAVIDAATTVPGAPTGVSGTPGNQQIVVSFTAPASDGGSPITAYTVTASPGGATATGAASPLTVTGLTNGTAYTFTVTATNAVGTSAASAPSAAVTPATVPDAPIMIGGAPGNTQATITFTAPASDGGSAITGYTVTSNPGGFTGTGSASPITVTGLTNGVTYTFTVTATNAVGTSAASAASGPVLPNASVPAAPTSLALVSATTSALTISFTAPINDGGSAITNYKYSINGGATYTAFSPADTTSPVSITGLTQGTTYSVRLRAVNAVGDGVESITLTATTAAISGNSRVLILGDATSSSYATNLLAAKTAMGYGGTMTVTAKQLNVPSYDGSADLTTSLYDVVIIYTNGGLSYAAALGTNLNNYVASGGHLIMNGFSWGNVSAITNFDYNTNSTFAYKGTMTLTTISTAYYPITHPITTGISTSTGMSVANVPNPITLTSSATAIAQYTDASGPYFMAVKQNGSARLVGVNAYIAGTAPSTGVMMLTVNSVYWCIGVLA